MDLLRPYLPVTLRRKVGTDLYGRSAHGSPRTVRVGVVRLAGGQVKTSVRADSSASRGRSDESTADAVLLFPSAEDVQAGDLVTVNGMALEVVTVEFRYTLQGRLDHYQVDLELSSSGG
jgi:hypothetical protein